MMSLLNREVASKLKTTTTLFRFVALVVSGSVPRLCCRRIYDPAEAGNCRGVSAKGISE